MYSDNTVTVSNVINSKDLFTNIILTDKDLLLLFDQFPENQDGDIGFQ